jgi:hypothetical protein
LESFKEQRQSEALLMAFTRANIHYRLIEEYYRGRRANRSGLPYINHIHEGLRVLEIIGAGDMTRAAFCIHPIVQSDEELRLAWSFLNRGASQSA